jgi:hypothetical protein
MIAVTGAVTCVCRKFCNIDGEGRQGQVVRRRRRGAQSRDGVGRVIVGNSIRLASGVELGDALG